MVIMYMAEHGISTHTLTWSVTFGVSNIDKTQLTFQLTRSRGAWLVVTSNLISIFSFQLTRSRGAWLCRLFLCWLFLCHFNSHAHVERDLRQYLASHFYFHFNSHAHVERDDTVLKIIRAFLISTHTLTWSVTSDVCSYVADVTFQLTRSRGAWPIRRVNTGTISIFQLTRSRGAWPYRGM